MAYVIAEPCIAVCDTACVDVCPVDCIDGPIPVATLRAASDEERAALARNQGLRLKMFIDPDPCIGCGACAPVCPVEAIVDEDDLPPAWAHHREENAAFFRDR